MALRQLFAHQGHLMRFAQAADVEPSCATGFSTTGESAPRQPPLAKLLAVQRIDDTADQIGLKQLFGGEHPAQRTQAGNRRRNLILAREKRRPRLGDARRAKATRLARTHLREPAYVSARDMTKLWIAAGRLAIRHENKRVLVAGDFDRAECGSVGHDIISPRVRDVGPIEPIGHAVGGRRQRERPGEKGAQSLWGEVIVLRAKHDTERIKRGVSHGASMIAS